MDVGDDMATVARLVPKLPPRWEILYESRVTQMMRSERAPLPEGDVDAHRFSVRPMFRKCWRWSNLHEAGTVSTAHHRVRERISACGCRGRLVAMAGERLRIGDFREVSAVCASRCAGPRIRARADTPGDQSDAARGTDADPSCRARTSARIESCTPRLGFCTALGTFTAVRQAGRLASPRSTVRR